MKKWRMYMVTILSVLGIGYFKLVINQYFQIQSPILLFFVAITISAWVGGFFHGMLATLLSIAFISSHLIEGDVASEPIWYFRFLLYFFDCLVISLICSKLRSSRNKLDRAYKSLKQVEMSLRQRESQIGRIFESNMLGIVFSQCDGTIIDTNDYFLDLLKLDKEKLRKGELNWSSIEANACDQNSKSILVDTLSWKNDAIRPFERDYAVSNGTKISVLIGAARADQDTVVAFVLDITNQKAAEQNLAQAKQKLEEGVILRTRQLTQAIQELSDSQGFLQSVIENIPNMIFVKEAKNLKFVRFNKAGAELLDFPVEELIGKSDYDFFPKEQAEFFMKKDREVINSKQVLNIPEEAILTKRGVRYLHTVKIPILNKAGEVQYLLGISQDITEDKNNEQQRLQLIQEQAARLEAEKIASQYAFLSAATAKLNSSLDVDIILREFTKDIIGNMADFCIVDYFNEPKNTFERFISSTNQAGKIESRSIKDIALRFESGRLEYLDNLNDGVIYTDLSKDILEKLKFSKSTEDRILTSKSKSIMIVPITTQKNVFGALTLISKSAQSIYTDLDLAVARDLAKRTSLAIDNANLYFKAHEANRAKTAFLANISHEIRTPLGAMLGFAEILLDDKNLREQTSSHVNTILKNGHQLLSLVDEVLDIAKIESEKIQIENLVFSPEQHLGDILSLLEIKAKAKGLELNYIKENELPLAIKTDPLRLRQILINVVGNAVKFTEHGQVDVIVNFSAFPDVRKGCLKFVVRDTGIGVAKNNTEKLFAPFSQGDSSMTRKFGGTGLGLFLSKKLAHLLGGDLVLNTKHKGPGCEFVISIEVGYSNEKVNPELINQQQNFSSYKNVRILVVDDSPENRIIVRSFLEKINLTVDEADNGEEGIRLAHKNNYDIAIMDIQMPVMDGFKAVEKLRIDGYKKPIIALTAHAMKGDREKCLSHGFDDYLCKPLNKKDLYRCVERFIPHSQDRVVNVVYH